ncbi:MAG: succinate dehydrogenase / fumarate reductase, cytochrome b subunit [Acidobacteriota bacterium]|jgi:succinate dehydrogenase / fumarate reductase cytochrome b subunit|nr:succinate dehydrogenase / fumarate reductase, cytochrome b subunit [Acidobacteriota bacterium]
MTWFGNFYRSSIGKKAVMALTGLVLFGWIFLHMVGNLKLYLGAVHMNEYAHFLRAMGAPAVPESGVLWAMRLLLLVCVIFHIHAAYALTRMAAAARPVAYRDRQYVKATYASRTMRWGGVILLLFIVYHLLHLTTGQAHHDFVKDDAYHNVTTGLRIWWVAAIYIIANLALGLHLYHGVWAMFGSLGLINPRIEAVRRVFATAFAVLITAGNISFPLAVLTGIVR